jgi:O-antigen/teichoic acid export membrane protein
MSFSSYGIAAVVGVVVIGVLVAIAWWWTRRRRRPRSRPVIEMDDARRERLRQIAATDYRPRRHARKDQP